MIDDQELVRISLSSLSQTLMLGEGIWAPWITHGGCLESQPFSLAETFGRGAAPTAAHPGSQRVENPEVSSADPANLDQDACPRR